MNLNRVDYTNSSKATAHCINKDLEKKVEKNRSSLKGSSVSSEENKNKISVFGKFLKKIGEGVAKLIVQHPIHEHKVICVPNEKNILDLLFSTKSRELKRELNISNAIKESNYIKGKIDKEEINVLVGYEEYQAKGYQPTDTITGFALTVDKATGSLDGSLEKKKVDFKQGLEFGKQILNGLNNLHQAGYVHGDLKAENILVFNKPATVQGNSKNLPPEKILRISDFGKTTKLAEGDKQRYVGNLRHVPPEKKLSQKGEVFGVALILIQLLEKEFVGENKMIIELDKKDVKASLDSKKIDKLSGIEKYMCQHKDCIQSASLNPLERFIFQGSEPSKKEMTANQEAIYKYIDCLCSKMNGKLTQDKISELKSLLKDMTIADPEKRPNLDKVLERYNKIISPS